MKIAILGFARDGQAAYEFLNRDGNSITICDQNQDIVVPAGTSSQLGPDYLKNLAQYDLIVRTAGLAPHLITAVNSNSIDVLQKITGNIDLFYKNSPTKNIIGVTGTKGKGTTSTLIAKMLEAAGKKVHLGGNIGIPALDLLKNNIQPDDWVVLEQGAFQLIDQQHSPVIGVCLMVEPEHMDWFKDMDEYLTAKQQMFIHQGTNDVAIYNAISQNSKTVTSVSPAKKIPYMEKPGAYIEGSSIVIDGQNICQTNELKLLGEHNWQNVCAAVTTVWQVTQDNKAIKTVLTSITGLEHRLELVREFNGVKYYDDSFGTTPETAIVAIEAFDMPKVVILGGSTKQSDYTKLAAVLAKSAIRQIILIGNTTNPDYKSAAPEIESALNAQGIKQITSLVKPGKTSMNEIVQATQSASHPGDVVLLSTACASFDLFKDYKDRGEQFKQAVLALV